MAWSRRKKIGVGLAIGLPLALLSTCVAVVSAFLMSIYLPSAGEPELYEGFDAALGHSRTEALLSEIVAGDWDMICFIGPYTPLKKIPEPRIQQLPDVPWRDVEMLFTVAVLNGSAQPRFIRVKRDRIDMTSWSQCFSRIDAPLVRVIGSETIEGQTRFKVEISTNEVQN